MKFKRANKFIEFLGDFLKIYSIEYILIEARHGFAHPNRTCWLPRWIERHRHFRPQHHYRRTEQEAAHFVALFVFELAGFVIPRRHLGQARWVDLAVPDGGHTAYDGCANQHVNEWAVSCVEDADNALIAGEEAGDAACCGGVDAEKIAWDVDHLAQRAGHRHVDAVIVFRA